MWRRRPRRMCDALVVVLALLSLFADAQFVEVTAMPSQIVLDLRYATVNNPTHQPLYDRTTCLLRRDVASALLVAAREVAQQGFALKLYDCFRPQAAQVALAATESDTRYVANPQRGSRHTRGAAVDLTLVDASGAEVEMPSPFDESSPRAHRDARTMSKAARRNLDVLERAMTAAGFVGLRTEWWHYDHSAWRRYPLVPSGWPATRR